MVKARLGELELSPICSHRAYTQRLTNKTLAFLPFTVFMNLNRHRTIKAEAVHTVRHEHAAIFTPKT